MALLTAGSDEIAKWLEGFSAQNGLTNMLGTGGYHILGILFFAVMAWLLYRAGMKKNDDDEIKIT